MEVLFDAICREHGIEYLLTQPKSPTTTGKIERFHRSLRAEFLSAQRPFTNLKTAQQALDEWIGYYNNTRPHQSLDMATPAERFTAGTAPIRQSVSCTPCDDRSGDDGVICQGDGTTGLPEGRDHLFGSQGMIGGLWDGVN